MSWGKPPDSGLDDQYTAEVFYRLQVAQNRVGRKMKIKKLKMREGR